MFSKQLQSALLAAASAALICGAHAAAAQVRQSAPPVRQSALDPCKLLTPDQIDGATSLNFGQGTPIIAGKSCQWISPSPKHGITTVDFWPADSWAKMKAQWAPSSQAVSGVGDDAFYYSVGTYGALAVKNGNSLFVLKVYGIAPDKQAAILKTLANDAIAKL